jgi:hypothetical protein
VILSALLLSALASAHRPDALAERMTVDDPEISWVLAGAFETGLEVYVLELSYETGFALPFEILVPYDKDLELHRPNFAIVGPGLPAPDDQLRAYLPYEVPEGMGVFLERNDDEERFVYFEGVMRRTMWSSGTIALPLQAGDHEVWIWSPNLTTGDFQFAFGVEEDFSDGGFGAIFSDWGTYAW